MKVYIIFLIGLFIALSDAGSYHKTKALTLSAENIKTLEIDCGAGFLKINGDENLKKIEVTANIEIRRIDEKDAERLLKKRLQLMLDKRGQRARLISNFDHSGSLFSEIFGNRPQITVDLTVSVPRNIALKIDDGSGFIKIQNIDGDIELNDGSGETTIGNVVGNIEIDDGSGELQIRDIIGNVYLDDGSGEINIRKVQGEVRVDDGSGSIIINGVEGNVIIEDDGSGGVHIDDVSGKIIRRDK